MSQDRSCCENCGGWLDRPALLGCDEPGHAEPTWSQQIVQAIERELDGRQGVGWSGVDPEIAEEIRDALARIIEDFEPEIRREADPGPAGGPFR